MGGGKVGISLVPGWGWGGIKRRIRPSSPGLRQSLLVGLKGGGNLTNRVRMDSTNAKGTIPVYVIVPGVIPIGGGGILNDYYVAGWWGRGSLRAFVPPGLALRWSAGQEVGVRPELGSPQSLPVPSLIPPDRERVQGNIPNPPIRERVFVYCSLNMSTQRSCSHGSPYPLPRKQGKETGRLID
jgi:hypothetical protein